MKFLLVYTAFVSFITCILYGTDKYKAIRGKWRIPEAYLLWLAVLGGAFGALFGMYLFRHKTRHKKFTLGVPALCLLQAVLLAVCYYRLDC